LSALTVLQVSHCALGGTLPSEIGRLTMLTQLMVMWNKISGTLPLQLGSLTNLKTLAVHQNQFLGTVPNLSKLSSLNLCFVTYIWETSCFVRLVARGLAFF
jgi:Leucine-rich repeat (LRR) protein